MLTTGCLETGTALTTVCCGRSGTVLTEGSGKIGAVISLAEGCSCMCNCETGAMLTRGRCACNHETGDAVSLPEGG